MANDITRMLREGARAETTRRPQKSYIRLWIAFTGLILYIAFVAVVTMTPQPVDQGFEGNITRLLEMLHRRGVPEWFGFNELEFTANIGMFVPLGFLLGLALSRRMQWFGIFLVPAFSAAIEWAQFTYLSERFATVEDVIANTAGGWIGLVFAALIRAAVYERDEKVIARAVWEMKSRR